MDHPTEDTESQCNLCPLQKVRSRSGEDPWANSKKYELFHGNCPRCVGEQSHGRDEVLLCVSCRHLRLRHLLLCRPETEHWLILDIYLNRDALQPCDFCRYLISCANEERRKDPLRWSGSSGSDVADHAALAFLDGGSNIYLDVLPGGPECHMQRQISGSTPVIVRPYIDWDWLIRWVQDHKVSGTSSQFHAGLQKQQLVDLHVIDVEDECVVKIQKNTQYLALSYVWGTAADDQDRCLTSNFSRLKETRGLRTIKLPRTVSDAMIACKRLEHRYLWVDRVCIVQDTTHEELWQQLDQMAAIYYHASMTLIATSGIDASHGLAGVSYPRDSKQSYMNLGSDLELCTYVQTLDQVLYDSTWWTRGWTFQEYISSRKSMFFTDSGLYLLLCDGKYPYSKTLSEGPTTFNPLHTSLEGFDMVETFTTRQLTKSTDILRASSGFLTATYGDHLFFGMPLDEFDRAMLWVASGGGRRMSTGSDAFPTWSWISATSPVAFCMNANTFCVGIAYWGRIVASDMTKSRQYSWSALQPTEMSPPMHTLTSRMVALAWLHGCINSTVPPYLSADCTRPEYDCRLVKHWEGDPQLFWNAAFSNYKGSGVFEHVDESLMRHAHLLLVHSQKASFTLDCRGQARIHKNHRSSPNVIVRNNDQRIAGFVSMDKCLIQQLQIQGQGNAEFIALSVSGNEDFRYYASDIFRLHNSHYSHLSVSKLYGCPCSTDGTEAANATHIAECPSHAEFYSVKQMFDLASYGENPSEEREQACSHHLRGLSFHDIKGKTVHDPEDRPFLWAMLITPSPDWAPEKKVYQRLGIGQIYLKRWLESEPVFETLALE